MCSIEMESLTDDVNKSFEDDMDEDQLAYVPRPLGPSQGQQVGVPRGRASGLQAGGVKRAAATRESREGYYTEEFHYLCFDQITKNMEYLHNTYFTHICGGKT